MLDVEEKTRPFCYLQVFGLFHESKYGHTEVEKRVFFSDDFIIWRHMHSYRLTSWHKHLVHGLGESKTLQEVQNQEPSSMQFLPKNCSTTPFWLFILSQPLAFSIFLGGPRRPRSRATALWRTNKLLMDPTRITTEVYSVYSHPWAQQRMARENADPVHGAMVFEEFGRITRQYFRHASIY